MGKAFIDSVQSFITNHIEPYESHFCFYLRYNLKHYEECTNAIHEGTNRALKYNSAPVGPSTNIEKSLAIICNDSERTVKKRKVASLDFGGTKIFSKLKCANKVLPMAEAITLENWYNKDSYESLKMFYQHGLWRMILIRKKTKQSKTLYELPLFKRVRQVKITDRFMCCSCNFRNRFGIDYPRVYHVVSQSQDFKQHSHHHISERWWNSFYQFACMSKNDKQFEALEKAMKIYKSMKNMVCL